MIAQGLMFRNEVKKRLIDLDMTQKQLAKELGISPSYLNDIIMGNRKQGGSEYIFKIIAFLKMDSSQVSKEN